MAEPATLRTQGMGRSMTIAGMVIAVLIFIVFVLDLAVGFPFSKASVPMDISFVVCALGLAFLSWTTMRELD